MKTPFTQLVLISLGTIAVLKTLHIPIVASEKKKRPGVTQGAFKC
jgi:hypothetical protein